MGVSLLQQHPSNLLVIASPFASRFTSPPRTCPLRIPPAFPASARLADSSSGAPSPRRRSGCGRGSRAQPTAFARLPQPGRRAWPRGRWRPDAGEDVLGPAGDGAVGQVLVAPHEPRARRGWPHPPRPQAPLGWSKSRRRFAQLTASRRFRRASWRACERVGKPQRPRDQTLEPLLDDSLRRRRRGPPRRGSRVLRRWIPGPSGHSWSYGTPAVLPANRRIWCRCKPRPMRGLLVVRGL